MTILKNMIKSISIFVMALFISIVIYPFLHELGHSIMAVLLGVRIVEINLLPTPNILCENAHNEIIKEILIGSSGIILPVIISLSIRAEKFWVWYSNLILKCICLLSVSISALAIIFQKSKLFLQDDMRIILGLWDSGKIFCLTIILCMAVILSFNIYKEIHKIIEISF